MTRRPAPRIRAGSSALNSDSWSSLRATSGLHAFDKELQRLAVGSLHSKNPHRLLVLALHCVLDAKRRAASKRFARVYAKVDVASAELGTLVSRSEPNTHPACERRWRPALEAAIAWILAVLTSLPLPFALPIRASAHGKLPHGAFADSRRRFRRGVPADS